MKLLKEMTKRQSPVWTSIALGAMAVFTTESLVQIENLAVEFDKIIMAAGF